MGRLVVQATQNVYKSAVSTFLPTPAKSHYLFNLRDFSRVIRGVLLLTSKRMGAEGEKLMRLWIHEVYRVFYDRLTTEQDRVAFFGIVKDTCQSAFKTSVDKILAHLTKSGNVKDENVRSLIFGDYMADDRFYDEVTDLKELNKRMEYFLEEVIKF